MLRHCQVYCMPDLLQKQIGCIKPLLITTVSSASLVTLVAVVGAGGMLLANFWILEPPRLVLRLFLGHLKCHRSWIRSSSDSWLWYVYVGAVQASASNAKLVNSEVIVNILSMVRWTERRKLHHSIDTNSYSTMFNFTEADVRAQVWLCYCLVAVKLKGQWL